MTNESEKILKGLWKWQYQPLEHQMLAILEDTKDTNPVAVTDAIARYKKMSIHQKITVLDRYASMRGL